MRFEDINFPLVVKNSTGYGKLHLWASMVANAVDPPSVLIIS
jgi:hypothetical protein